MSKHYTCNELGVCADRVPACPDCPERNKIKLRAASRFIDRPGCASEAYTQPTFPFAPGVIQRASDSASIDVPDEWFALSKADTAKIIAVVLILAAVATLAVRWWYVTH